ncbi:MAG: hypothetical protein LBQ52_04115, partial [Helicobacteraceae bacterium]|nr:hypothetical protein [Helicobacteraceae bacterium]
IEYLDISEIDGNPDITPIGQLSALKTLNINLRKSTKQNNLSCLNNLNNLEELHLFGKFKKKSLKLNFNGLKTFSPQLNCIDINELPQLKSLRRLDIINQKLETLSGLENCIRLNTILLNNVKIENQNILSPIFKLKELETISLSYIKTITDFTFIKDKSPIKNIYLWSLNGLESIKGIEKLYLLEKYSQRGEHENKNAIDFSELLKLKKLKEVEIKIGKTNKDAESKLNIIIKQIINKRSSSA